MLKKEKVFRHFSKNNVPLEKVIYALKVAVQALLERIDSRENFIIVDDQVRKENIRQMCGEQEKLYHEQADENLKVWFKAKNITYSKPFLTDALLLLAVFSDQRQPYATESTWLAIGYLLTSLEEVYLSTLTYTLSYPENVKTIFGVPEYYKLEAIMSIGYSEDSKPKEPRNPLKDFVYKNFLGQPYWKPINIML
ncbi:MAG: nitroreductase family protein [Nitrososphaeria archaeon]